MIRAGGFGWGSVRACSHGTLIKISVQGIASPPGLALQVFIELPDSDPYYSVARSLLGGSGRMTSLIIKSSFLHSYLFRPRYLRATIRHFLSVVPIANFRV